MAITFDTLQFVNELEAAGIERKQATAFVDIVKKSHDSTEVATKRDLKELELRMTIKLGSLIIGATGIIIAIMKL